MFIYLFPLDLHTNFKSIYFFAYANMFHMYEPSFYSFHIFWSLSSFFFNFVHMWTRNYLVPHLHK